jgi:hypothetical protein
MPIYVGTQKIDVSGVEKVYVGTQLVYQNAPVVLSSITITGQKTSLNRGASFSFGGTVTAHYSNGSTANVTTASTFSGYNMAAAGTYTVTVSYTENSITKTTTYQLTVNKAWSTIWSGTKTATFSGGKAPSSVAIANPNLTGNQTFRITWAETTNTDSASYSWAKTYYNNGTATTSKPGSPLQFTINTSNNNLKRVGIGRKSTSNQYYEALVVDYRPYSSSTRPGFYITAPHDSTSTTVTLKITVTKIERYY